MELRPLEQWVCDDCGENIDLVAKGWIKWIVELDASNLSFGFRIVHHALE